MNEQRRVFLCVLFVPNVWMKVDSACSEIQLHGNALKLPSANFMQPEKIMTERIMNSHLEQKN